MKTNCMATSNNRHSGGGERDMNTNRTEQQSSVPNDLPDSPEDEKRLESEEVTIDLPDVKDIPGQEFVHAPPLGELGDTTISSADEEGEGLFDDADLDEDDDLNDDSNVTKTEKQMLANTEFRESGDNDRLQRAALDSTDFQGEKLNEGSFGERQTGSDLDIPDEVDETTTESMGQGDEENKYYSMGSDDNDNMNEGTP
jgi:hypothetical protein